MGSNIEKKQRTNDKINAKNEAKINNFCYRKVGREKEMFIFCYRKVGREKEMFIFC